MVTLGSTGARTRLGRLLRAPPFSAFPRHLLEDVADSSHDLHARRGAVLFRRGDAARSAYVVDRGAVRLSTTTPDGRPIVFRLVASGEAFGFLAVLNGDARSCDATVLTGCRLVVVPYRVLADGVERSPPAALALAREASRQTILLRGRLAGLAARDVPDRVAAVLVELAASFGVRVADGVLVDVPLRHEDVAGLVGVARETVSRMLSTFAARGFVRREGERYVVLDPELVAAASTA